MKRFVLLLTVAAVMLAMSALPALARTTEVVSVKNPGKNGPVFYVNEKTEVIKFTGGTIRY